MNGEALYNIIEELMPGLGATIVLKMRKRADELTLDDVKKSLDEIYGCGVAEIIMKIVQKELVKKTRL